MADGHNPSEGARAWLQELQACIRAVDYERARPLFAEDVVAFGTYTAVISGRESLERDQWMHIWPMLNDFTFRLNQVHCLGTDQALCVVVPWDSVARRSDGSTFDRPGRATLLLEPRGERLVAAHSHFSVAPSSVLSTQSSLI
jgi:ketosteroid isomerase-like protein